MWKHTLKIAADIYISTAVCLGKADFTEIVSPTRYATAHFLSTITLCQLLYGITLCKLLKLNSPVKVTGKMSSEWVH